MIKYLYSVLINLYNYKSVKCIIIKIEKKRKYYNKRCSYLIQEDSQISNWHGEYINNASKYNWFYHIKKKKK